MTPSIQLAMRCLLPGAALILFARSGIGLPLDQVRGELRGAQQVMRGCCVAARRVWDGRVVKSFAGTAGHVLRRAP